MSEDFADLFGDRQKPVRNAWEGHTVIAILPAGQGEYPTLKFECHEADRDDTTCTSSECHVRELYNNVGWDVLRCEDDIELGRLEARADWSDPDEPWIDVK